MEAHRGLEPPVCLQNYLFELLFLTEKETKAPQSGVICLRSPSWLVAESKTTAISHLSVFLPDIALD